MKRLSSFFFGFALLFCLQAVAGATPMFIGGAFLDVEEHPLVGNEGIVMFGTGSADSELGDADADLVIDLFGYETTDDTIFIDALLLDFDTDDPSSGLAHFSLSPASVQHTSIEGPILGTGVLTATVEDLVSNTTGVDLTAFIGGDLLVAYSGVDLTPGGSFAGDSGTAAFSPVPTASFSLAAVPEPSAIALAVLGMLSLFVMGWQKLAAD